MVVANLRNALEVRRKDLLEILALVLFLATLVVEILLQAGANGLEQLAHTHQLFLKDTFNQHVQTERLDHVRLDQVLHVKLADKPHVAGDALLQKDLLFGTLIGLQIGIFADHLQCSDVVKLEFVLAPLQQRVLEDLAHRTKFLSFGLLALSGSRSLTILSVLLCGGGEGVVIRLQGRPGIDDLSAQVRVDKAEVLFHLGLGDQRLHTSVHGILGSGIALQQRQKLITQLLKVGDGELVENRVGFADNRLGIAGVQREAGLVHRGRQVVLVFLLVAAAVLLFRGRVRLVIRDKSFVALDQLTGLTVSVVAVSIVVAAVVAAETTRAGAALQVGATRIATEVAAAFVAARSLTTV
mmetsp:Transcript_32585/g.55673  ORF Transcript_32585/g.55673 Transcript_32585/m.55673 type:complete len:354 (-) Transcript_32585:1270-2331(-)